MKTENGPEIVKQSLENFGLEGLIAIGGDDTLGVANSLHEMGMNMVGVPKTIDNDLSCTDFTFGFDTAANIAMEQFDRLHTTADAHSRCFVVECMGRQTGWIALQAGLAGNAHLALIPEYPKTFDEIYEFVKQRYISGERYTMIAVAEGFEILGMESANLGVDAFGNKLLLNKDLARHLATMLERTLREDETLDSKRKYFETRSVVLGHLQRGGVPNAFDRVLGMRLGVKAGELAANKQYGYMASLRSTHIVAVDLKEAVTKRKQVDKEFYDAAKLFFR